VRSRKPERAIAELQQAARQALPTNWKIAYDEKERALTITREQPVQSEGNFAFNLPSPRPPTQSEPMEAMIGFRVQAYLAPEAWQRQHQALTQRMEAIRAQLPPQAGKEILADEYIPDSDAQRPLVVAYNRARLELNALPEYHYADLGLSCFWFAGTLEPFEGLVIDAERAECRQVYERFVGLLEKYRPAGDVQSAR
jgi:hypothetical protein